MMKPFRIVAAATVLVLAASVYLNVSSNEAPPQPPCCATAGDESSISVEVVSNGLNRPWAMAFLPDGSILVTERVGSLRRIVDGQISEPVQGLPAIASVGQGGLLDIALDPDFSKNQLLYFTYSEPSENGREYGTAVARGHFESDQLRLTGLERIFTSNRKSSGGKHFGSRIRFHADKTLSVTLGDRGNQPRAQDPFDHAGSVIRINRDGSVPAGNPFADGKNALAEIWSLGHRNPQGAAIHPDTGQLWTLSHGARGGDEVNKIEAGRNYGWPVISYGRNYSGSGFEKGHAAAGYEQPEYYWDPSIAPSGLAFYSPRQPLIPAWNGSLLAGALKAEYLSRLLLDDGRIVAEEKYFEGRLGRIRDVRTGPDGAVWLLTDSGNGKLIRLTSIQ